MVERPRMFLDTKTTNSITYVDLLKVQISADAEGLSYFDLSIDPDPAARYKIIVAKLLNANDLELTAIWTVELPHLTSGVYKGFEPTDWILIQHKSVDAAITVKSGIALEFNEVVE